MKRVILGMDSCEQQTSQRNFLVIVIKSLEFSDLLSPIIWHHCCCLAAVLFGSINIMRFIVQDKIRDTLSNNLNSILIRDEFVSLTGAQIVSQMNIYRQLFTQHLAPRSRIGIFLPNSAVKGLSIIAVIATGHVPVLINQFDNNRLAQVISASQLSAVICPEFFDNNQVLPCLTVFVDNGGGVKKIKPATETVTYPSVHPETALILYTSGSMGEPKGVQIPQKGILKTADELIKYFNLDKNTVSPIILPVCHTMALNTHFFPTFFVGGVSEFHNSTSYLGQIYRKILFSKGTFMALIGDILRVCWDEKRRKNLEPALSVKHVQIAGGIILEEHLNMAKELFPNATIHKGYGLTEAIRVSMIDSNDPDFFQNTAGSPLPFQEIQIRSEEGNLCGVGEVGELYVKGPNVMLGYDNCAQSPIGSDGFLKTGDLACFDSKRRICIHGRVDSVFKVKGEKVSALAIENAVKESTSHIRDVKCLPIQEDSKMRAVIFLEVPGDEQLQKFSQDVVRFEKDLRKKMEVTKYLPREIVILKKFPRTETSKPKLKTMTQYWSSKSGLEKMNLQSMGLNFFTVNY